ncbi:MAG: hypothetical protein PF444_05550 [Bacteroidales bacterium]|jgi:hypothetical protein|nr:hypothetical protein [Bacteroidales bacterium]
MIRITLTFLLSTFILTFTHAQSADLVNKREAIFDGTTLGKHALYLSLGGGSQSLIYEINMANTHRSAWYFKSGIGFNQEIFGSSAQHLLAGITYLTGRQRKSHFELSAGSVLMFEAEDYRYYKQQHYENQSIRYFIHFNPTAYMGYRYHKPGGHFIFRYGFGYPEITAMSFGYAF